MIHPFSEEFKGYVTDESHLDGHAEYIAFPGSEAELAETVRWCAAREIPMTVQGGLTGLTGGATPLGGMVLNLSGMSRILGLRQDEAGNFYLRVQPGILLTQVRAALALKSFDTAGWDAESLAALQKLRAGAWMFSPDPTETTASIGGMAACNASGARSLHYGATRRHIQALRAVLADGSITNLRRERDRAQGRHFSLPLEGGGVRTGELPDFDTMTGVVNAGFCFTADMDLVDLFLGSQGTLGIISELELRLVPAPKLLWGVTAFLPDDETALRFVRVMKGGREPGMPQFPCTPVSLEYFGAQALDMMREYRTQPAYSQIPPLPAGGCACYAEFSTDEPESFLPTVKLLQETLTALGADPRNTWVARGAKELEHLLFFRHAVPEIVERIVEENKRRNPALTLLSSDMAVDDDHFPALFRLYQSDLAAAGMKWVLFGHIGENHLHPNLLAESRAEYQRGLRLFEKWAADVGRLGGTISGEHGIGKLKRELALIQFGPEKMMQMCRLKRRLDPKLLLSRGNILTMDE